ncbi:MAG: toll/interleukin-1 receptor domain-containing protein, partial [Hyphomonadaceae bacterium]
MSEIFISYKSERRNAARHLAKVLGCYGFDVWYDYGLIPGDDFEPRLMAELGSSKVVMVLWCGMAVKSEWVQREARTARANGKYLPMWIEAATLPPEFGGADTINLTTWDGSPRSHMLDRLVLDISRRIGRDPIANVRRLIDLDEDWRGYGAPSLSQFALGKAASPHLQEPIEAPGQAPGQTQAPRQILGAPPDGITPNLRQHWTNAQNGVAESMFQIGWNYADGGNGLPKNPQEAVRLYGLAAEQGHPKGQSYLGYMHREGFGGLAKNDLEAVRLYKLAAAQGDALGQASLAFMYERGRGGLAKDDAEAVRLYKLAAAQGDAYAQSNLGVMYENAQGGLAKDDAEAARLYKLSAEQGNATGQVNLGYMYESGRGGLPKDDAEAARLYKLSADQGHPRGQANLGLFHAHGRGGLPKNETEAARLYRLAADQGNASGQVNLGIALRDGNGVPQDDHEAVRL